MKTLNLVGRQISRLRYKREWTQDKLADELQRAGWPITRSGVSKIESGGAYVPDFRLLYIADVLGVPLTELFPKTNPKTPVHETILQVLGTGCRRVAPELTAPFPGTPSCSTIDFRNESHH